MTNDYWRSLTWPAAPNQDDYRVFEQYCSGRVLLLGSTKMLLPLATEAWDIDPVYDDPKMRSRDWLTLDEHWDTIILDGALSYGKEFTEQLLAVVLPNCDCFISRVFLNPNWPTRYAVYFPQAEELNPVPEEIAVNQIYSFYIWNKQ